MRVFSDVLEFLAGAPALIGLMLTALVIFLTSRWRVGLLALLAQYFLVGLILWRSIRPEIALLKVLVGVLVAGILYLSARQFETPRPGEGTEGAGEPEAVLRAGWLEGPLGLPLRLLSVLLVVLAVVRLFGDYRLTVAPIDVALVAVWLGAMGVLCLVLGGDPVRTALAVLTILAGFDLVYSGLERSLAMVGVLSAFYLLVALAFAYLTTVHRLDVQRAGRAAPNWQAPGQEGREEAPQ